MARASSRVLFSIFCKLLVITECCLVSTGICNFLDSLGVGHQTTYFIWEFLRIYHHKNVEGFIHFVMFGIDFFSLCLTNISCPFSSERYLLSEANFTYCSSWILLWSLSWWSVSDSVDQKIYRDFPLLKRWRYLDGNVEKLSKVFRVTFEWRKDVNIPHYTSQ